MKNKSNQKEKTVKKVQLNSAIPEPMKRAIKETAKEVGLKLEDLTADAFRVYVADHVDSQIELRRTLFKERLKKRGESVVLAFAV